MYHVHHGASELPGLQSFDFWSYTKACEGVKTQGGEFFSVFKGELLEFQIWILYDSICLYIYIHGIDMNT